MVLLTVNYVSFKDDEAQVITQRRSEAGTSYVLDKGFDLHQRQILACIRSYYGGLATGALVLLQFIFWMVFVALILFMVLTIGPNQSAMDVLHRWMSERQALDLWYVSLAIGRGYSSCRLWPRSTSGLRSRKETTMTAIGALRHFPFWAFGTIGRIANGVALDKRFDILP